MWLTVLGRGSWRWDGKTYRAGVHEVGDDVAMAARRAPVASLVVTVDPPVIHQKIPGPLTLADLKKPRRSMGVTLAGNPTPAQVANLEPEGIPLDHPCGLCEDEFPSAPALARHIEFVHPR
jgi:hypothetical protein